jgi:hypothetical protein
MQEARRIALTLKAVEHASNASATPVTMHGNTGTPVVVFDPTGQFAHPNSMDGYVRFMPWWLLRADCVRLCPIVGHDGHYIAYACVPNHTLDACPAALRFILTAVHVYRQPIIITNSKHGDGNLQRDNQVMGIVVTVTSVCILQ